jgi:hypothetical protein
VTLFPRLSALPQKPFDPNDRIASFVIRNDGYFKVTNVETACSIWKLGAGRVTFTDSYNANNRNMQNVSALAPTEAMTTTCGMVALQAIDHIDLGVIIYYRPWPFTFVRKRRVFRYVVLPGRGGELNWFEQPSAELEVALDAYLHSH